PASLEGGRATRMSQASMPVLARDRVRFVGEAVAMVVAEAPGQALDAAEAVYISFGQLPAISGVERAMASGAPAIWPDVPGNVALDWEHGDTAAVYAAFARAAHVTRGRLMDTRPAPRAMEPPAAI